MIFESVKNFFDLLAGYYPILMSLYIGFLIGWVWGVGSEREKFDKLIKIIKK